MRAEERENPRQILVLDRMSGSAQALYNPLDLNRVPHQDGIRDQAQATGLIHDLFVVALPEFPLVGEEKPLRQALPILTAVQLETSIAAQVRIMEPSQ